MQGFKRILVPELNMGQLLMMLQARFLMKAIGLNKVQGRPFTVSEVEEKIRQVLADL